MATDAFPLFGAQGGRQFDFLSGGQNQFMNFPGLPMPGAGSKGTPFSFFSGAPAGTTPTSTTGGAGPLSGTGGVAPGVLGAGSVKTGTPLFPQFSRDFFNWLAGQIGRGASPFDVSTMLPSGGATAPGQLSAPLNPIMSMLQSYYQTGQGGPPGFGTLGEMSKTGMPIDVMPEWQAMVAAMQRPEAEARANLRESFAFGGNLASSPFGRAETDFETQAALQKQALLGGLEAQALEAARGRQVGASEFLGGMGTEFAQALQGLDQESINRMMAEFIRTRPEYAPFLNMLFAGATTFPPLISKDVGIGGLGGALSGAGTALGGIADLWKVLFPGKK